MDFKKLSNKVTKEELEEIVLAFKREDELECLEAGGVDNWSWYGEALDEFDGKYWNQEYLKIDSYYEKGVK